MAKEGTSNEKLEKYIEDIISEDMEENLQIAHLAKEELFRVWKVGFDEEEIKQEDPDSGAKLVLGFYSKVYECIMEKLKEKRQADNPSYGIKIADIVLIGYDDDSDDGESEKIGNFCPYISDIPHKKIENNFDPEDSSIERCTQWMTENVKEQRKTITDIATKVVKVVGDDINFFISSPTPVFPMFATIHEQLVEWMKLKRAEEDVSEYMINFCGCFDIYARLTEDGEAVIEYSPNPSQKLETKSDATASAVKE